MRKDRQLEVAKNRFSEVVNEAIASGPQVVTRHGAPVVVVVAVETWRGLTGARPSFKQFLRDAPLEGLCLEREGGEREDLELP